MFNPLVIIFPAFYGTQRLITLLTRAHFDRALAQAVFSPWRWGGSSPRAWMPTYVSILRIPQMTWVWRAKVEWYIDRGKPKNSEKIFALCPPQTPHGLTRARTRASEVRGRRLTAWAMARPLKFLTSAVDGDEWLASHPGRALAPGKGPPVPFVQEAETQSRSGLRGYRKKSFRLCRGSNLDRLVARHYTDWATRHLSW
jgi:hypothetical protein